MCTAMGWCFLSWCQEPCLTPISTTETRFDAPVSFISLNCWTGNGMNVLHLTPRGTITWCLLEVDFDYIRAPKWGEMQVNFGFGSWLIRFDPLIDISSSDDPFLEPAPPVWSTGSFRQICCAATFFHFVIMDLMVLLGNFNCDPFGELLNLHSTIQIVCFAAFSFKSMFLCCRCKSVWLAHVALTWVHIVQRFAEVMWHFS